MTNTQTLCMDEAGETGEVIFRDRPGAGSAEASKTVAVDAEALGQILQALIGPGHHIRELQATRSLHALGYSNPIDTLIESYNAAIAATAATGEAS